MQTQLKQTPFGHPGETDSNNSPTTSTWHESNPPRSRLVVLVLSIESSDTIKQ